MSKYGITVLAGDGIGPEIISEAMNVMLYLRDRYGLGLDISEGLVGGASIDRWGVPLTESLLDRAKESDAVLLGAVGGPKWEPLDYSVRPERALLALRKELNLFANLRPVTIQRALVAASTLKQEIVSGVDIMVVRELTGGLYFGEPKGIDSLVDGSERGFNTMVYTTNEIERIARVAFEIARSRKKKVTSVDKANVLEVTELWRRVVVNIHNEYPDIELEHMYVDNCAMQLVRKPAQFDTILTGNTFGDILSDEAAMLTGSIGMLPSASLCGNVGMYEPIHGSAPDIAGKDEANPIAAILSVAMMFRYSFSMPEIADSIETAVAKVLDGGLRTMDIWEEGTTLSGCREMGSSILSELQLLAP